MELEFIELMGTAAILADETLGVKKGEKVLIVTDSRIGNYPGTKALGQALAAALAEREVDFNMVSFAARNQKNGDIPELTEQMVSLVDAVVFLVSQSILYSNALRRILFKEKHARLLLLPLGQDMKGTDDIFYKLPRNKEEFHLISDITGAVGKTMTEGKHTVRLVGKNGTDLTMEFGELIRFVHDGHANKPGSRATFPFGTFSMGVNPNGANGKLVFDTRFAPFDGFLEDPIVMTVTDGYVSNIEGGIAAEKFKEIMDKLPYPAEEKLCIAEFGLGFDKKAELSSKDLGECEHVYGAAHIGIGANVTFGGPVAIPSHIDGMITDATVYVDGELVEKDGEYLIQV